MAQNRRAPSPASEYMILNEADRVEMQGLMTKMARGGWELDTFLAIPDPAHKTGRKAPKDGDEMENLAVIYVALMRRGTAGHEK